MILLLGKCVPSEPISGDPDTRSIVPSQVGEQNGATEKMCDQCQGIWRKVGVEGKWLPEMYLGGAKANLLEPLRGPAGMLKI